MKLVLAHSYTRRQIARRLGGDPVGFLPHRAGRVVCIALDPRKNPQAPEVVPVGPGRTTRLRWASVLHEQGTAVPLFIKLGRNYWEYRGRFKCVKYITDPATVRRMADPVGREDARAIMRLQPCDPGPASEVDDPFLWGSEGGILLRIHRERERNRGLIKAKKAAAVRRGTFACEACGLDFQDHANGLGKACCDVHHLRPLGDLGRGETMATRLQDLALMCTNCHRMLHASQPMLSVRALARRIRPGA